MRWYVTSFLAGAFELKRHICCDAAQVVYQIGHERARELYDLVLLECRRVMFDHLPPGPLITAGQLTGRRERWMMRYAPLLDAVEFNRFFVLTRGLGPFVVYLSDPANCSRRQDRCLAVTRRTIEYVLFGHPDATALFQEDSKEVQRVVDYRLKSG
jgi:hypothetical protein